MDLTFDNALALAQLISSIFLGAGAIYTLKGRLDKSDLRHARNEARLDTHEVRLVALETR